MTDEAPSAAHSFLRRTKLLTERSVERLPVATSAVPAQHRAAYEKAVSIDITQADALALSRHSSPAVLRALAANPKTWSQALQVASTSTDEETRRLVASHGQAPSAVLSVLAADASSVVRLAACRNPELDRRTLDMVARKDKEAADVYAAVAAHPNTPAAALMVLAGRRIPAVRMAVAVHPAATSECLNALAQTGEESVLLAMAGRGSMPSSVQFKLAGSWSQAVVRALLLNRELEPDVLHSLLTSLNEEVRLRMALHPRTAPAALLELTGDRDPMVRSALLCRASVPPEVLQRLVTDTDPAVAKLAKGDARWLALNAEVFPALHGVERQLRDDEQDLRRALRQLDVEAKTEARHRLQAWVGETQTEQERQLRARHQASVLKMKHDAQVLLEQDLGQLRRQAAVDQARQRQQGTKSLEDQLAREREALRQQLTQNRKDQVAAEQVRLKAQAAEQLEQRRQALLTEHAQQVEEAVAHSAARAEVELAAALADLRAALSTEHDLALRAAESEHQSKRHFDLEAQTAEADQRRQAAVQQMEAELRAEFKRSLDTRAEELATQQQAELDAVREDWAVRERDALDTARERINVQLRQEHEAHLASLEQLAGERKAAATADHEQRLTQSMRDLETLAKQHLESELERIGQAVERELADHAKALSTEANQVVRQQHERHEADLSQALAAHTADQQARLQAERTRTAAEHRVELYRSQAALATDLDGRFQERINLEIARLDAEYRAEQAELEHQAIITRQAREQELRLAHESRLDTELLNLSARQAQRLESERTRLEAESRLSLSVLARDLARTERDQSVSGEPDELRALAVAVPPGMGLVGEPELSNLAIVETRVRGFLLPVDRLPDRPAAVIRAIGIVLEHGDVRIADVIGQLNTDWSPRMLLRALDRVIEGFIHEQEHVVLREDREDGTHYVFNPRLQRQTGDRL